MSKTLLSQRRKPFLAARSAELLVLVAVLPVTISRAAEIRVDAGGKNSAVRALHGINGGPICYGGAVDLSANIVQDLPAPGGLLASVRPQ